MAPKRARHNKGQDQPDPNPQKRVKLQVRMTEALLHLVSIKSSLTISYQALANMRLQNTPQNTHQHTHENAQRSSTRIREAAARRAQVAANNVFRTTELLEQILLEVGTMEDLIRMRRVCHKWQDVIQDTRSVQRIIFLSPQDLDHEWHTWVRIGPGPPHYKLVKEPKTSRESDGSTDEDYPGILQSACINPLLFCQLSGYASIPIWDTGSYDRWTSEELVLREGARIKGTKIKVSSPLLNMFATQPPLCEMTFRTSGDPARQIRNSKGIKVIDVLRVAEGLVGGWAGRVVVDYAFFPPEDADAIYTEEHLDLFYTWNIG